MRRTLSALVLITLPLASACGAHRGDSAASVATATPSETATPTGTATPSSTPTAETPLRIVALGDTGTGEAGEFAVANAIGAKCEAVHCDFGILLGDNFYPSGVTSAADANFDAMFQTVYGGLGFPFYVTLGNHDYGVNGAGTQFDIGQYEVEYAVQHDNWKLPNEYYTFEDPKATFVALGTDLIFWDHNGAVAEQGAYFTTALDGSSKPWRISLGHHPYLSNGTHGNAGSYDGVSYIPVVNGSNVKTFFEQYLCGKVDLYLSGHDHSRQVFEGPDSCPGLFVVSGAGAKTTDLPGTQASLFQKNTLGFTYLEITSTSIKVEMIDVNGTVEYTTTLTH